MNYERQMEILWERHGIGALQFQSHHAYGTDYERLLIGTSVLEDREFPQQRGVDVWDTVHEHSQRLHNWVAAVTYAKARDAARRAKDKTP